MTFAVELEHHTGRVGAQREKVRENMCGRKGENRVCHLLESTRLIVPQGRISNPRIEDVFIRHYKHHTGHQTN